MAADLTARSTRGLALAMSLLVSITCASPTSPVHHNDPDLVAARGGATILRVTLADSSIVASGSTRATATLLSAWGGEFAAARTTWRSSDASVAMVDRTGFVRAIGPGSTEIIAESQGLTGKALLTVEAAPPPPPPVATGLRVVTQPEGAVSGNPLSQQPVLEVHDATGGVVSTSTAVVVVTLTGGNATLSGSAVMTAVAGVVRFTDLAIVGVGTFTLTFSSAGLGSTGATVTTTAPPAPPPSTDRGLVFASDWSSGTGTSESARRDLDKARPWSMYAGNAVSGIESAASLGLTDWPTANAFVVRTSQAAMGSMWAQLDYDLGRPAPGDHRYFRVYVALLWEDNHGDGNGMDGIEHGIESADLGYRNGGGGGDGLNPMMLSRSNGTWNPAFREISTGYRYASAIGLQKFRTYRLEWHIAYAVGSYTIEVRIYDSANQLVASTSDFTRRNPFPLGERLSSAVLSLASADDHRWFRVGSNGPTSNYPDLNVDVGDAFRAHGAVAVCLNTWCGPYVPGESP